MLGPLGNYLVPLMIGARRMAFPRVEALTLWLTVLAGIILLSAIALGGFPTGWTGYAPLADQARAGSTPTCSPSRSSASRWRSSAST